jgi:hypothetical protein
VGLSTPYDELPLEVRRQNWGWFGEPWPSGVCYDEDGRLLTEMRKDFPEGETCPWCEEVFQPGDQGQAMPFGGAVSGVTIRHQHKECLLRQVVGSLAHLEGRCSCYGGSAIRPEDWTRRDEALAVWAYWLTRAQRGLLDV